MSTYGQCCFEATLSFQSESAIYGTVLHAFMTRKKDAQDISKNPSDTAFIELVTAVYRLRMEFSERYNAIWNIEDAVRMLVAMAEASLCANQTAEKYAGRTLSNRAKKVAIPSPQWLLGKLGSINLSEMIERCDSMLRYAAEEAAEYAAAMFQKNGEPAVIAMDETKIPRYDKKSNRKHLKKSKGEKGTVHFEVYLTCKIILKRLAAVHTGCSMVGKGDKHADLVRKMLEKCMDLGISPVLGGKRSRVLLDRGFYSVDVMYVIDDAGFAFIMPAVKNCGIKNAIDEHVQGQRPAVSWYTVKSAEGRKFTLQLFISKKPKKPKSDSIYDQYHVFATTLKCRSYAELRECVPREYRRRWDIETSYRCVKSIRPRTTSLNPSIRLALFYISLVIYNIWTVIRNLYDSETQRTRLKVLVHRMIEAECTLQNDAPKTKCGLKRDPG